MMLRRVHNLMILIPLVAAMGIAAPGCVLDSDPDGVQTQTQPSVPPPPVESTITSRTIDETRPITGVAIVAHHISDMPLYLEAVDHIAAMGANSVIVVTPMFQENIHAHEIRFLPEKCPTASQLEAILRRAKRHGMHTTLLPIVLLEESGDKEWRGVIAPDDWDKWWASYDSLIDHFLDITERVPVDLLGIGSELNSTEDQLERWQSSIDRVRARFTGQITYSANWDRFDKVKLWQMVDVMSVSSYFEIGRRLDNGIDPSPDNLAAAWKPDMEKLLATAARNDIPLLLTEVGYPSLPWAARYPWNYVPADGVKTDHDAQAICFMGFFQAWLPELRKPDSRAAGFYIYAWDPYHHGQESDTGYGFHGKPAHGIISTALNSVHGDPDDE